MFVQVRWGGHPSVRVVFGVDYGGWNYFTGSRVFVGGRQDSARVRHCSWGGGVEWHK